jgi:hypothetical protein
MENELVLIGLIGAKVVVDIFCLLQLKQNRKDFRIDFRKWKEEFENNVDERLEKLAPEGLKAVVEKLKIESQLFKDIESASIASLKDNKAKLEVAVQTTMQKEQEIKILELQLKLKEKEEFKLKQLLKLQEAKNVEKSESEG